MDFYKFFISFLQENNFQYIQTDQSVAFSNNGKNYLLIIDKADQDYYRLTLPKLGVPEKIQTDKLNDLFIKITSEFKVGKVIKITNNGLIEYWLSYEQLLRGTGMDDCSYVFSRSIKILSEMLDYYRILIQTYIEEESNPLPSKNIEPPQVE